MLRGHTFIIYNVMCAYSKGGGVDGGPVLYSENVPGHKVLDTKMCLTFNMYIQNIV